MESLYIDLSLLKNALWIRFKTRMPKIDFTLTTLNNAWPNNKRFFAPIVIVISCANLLRHTKLRSQLAMFDPLTGVNVKHVVVSALVSGEKEDAGNSSVLVER